MSGSTKRGWFGCMLPTAVLFVALSIGAWFVISRIRNVVELTTDCYCVEAVTAMVIHHLESNERRWPTGWEDLRQDHAKLPPDGLGVWDFEELQRRVDVDWKADPEVLSRSTAVATSPPFKVIWLRNGQSHFWSGGEPNQLILEYLKTGKSMLIADENVN